MSDKENLLKILRIPHLSEKSAHMLNNNNTFTIKVRNNTNKIELIQAIKKLFQKEVIKINTLIIKGKVKKYKNSTGRCSNWKKAYITLKKGQKLDFIENSE